jgi:3-keto-5-aminohexanoate cleavage enzyme
MGVLGAIRGTPEDLTFLVTKAKVLFGKENFTWSVIGVGAAEINLSTMAIHMGGHVRVGLEDNIYAGKGVLAKSNAELVEKVVVLAGLLSRELATPVDARRILGLKGKDQVNY